MDQPKTDKFAELSPVLELVYVMLTNMAKYMDVYATDIEAEATPQFVEANEALSGAIRKFDTLYGLKSPASATEQDFTADEDTQIVQEDVEEVPATPMPAAPQQDDNNKPYNFASGDDQESLKKAKQAVEELKTLFADMKKQEQVTPAAVEPVAAPEPVLQTPTEPPANVPAVTTSQPVATQSMPTFVAPTAVADATAPVAPAPAATTAAVQPAQDATEIDSILAELKKLQNKGTTQL